MKSKIPQTKWRLIDYGKYEIIEILPSYKQARAKMNKLLSQYPKGLMIETCGEPFAGNL